MAAIYERQQTKHAGSFASDTAILSVGGQTVTLGIVSSLQISFAQAISRIYSIGKVPNSGNKVPVFYVGGRTQGQVTMARVVGPQSAGVCNFYKTMGNVCDPKDLTFKLETGCKGGSGGGKKKVQYKVEDAVMTNIGLSVGSQDMIVNENMTMMFANLECL